MTLAESLLRTYTSGDLVVDAQWVTWDLAVFEIHHPTAHGVVAVPRAELDTFVRELWDGHLDLWLVTELANPAVQRRRLADGDDVADTALYGGIDRPERLVPTERNPRTGRIDGPRGPRGRNSKRSSQNDALPGPRRRLSTRLLVAAAIVAIVAIAGTAFALSGGGGDDGAAAPSTTTTTDPGGPSSAGPSSAGPSGTLSQLDGTWTFAIEPPEVNFATGHYSGARVSIAGDRVAVDGNPFFGTSVGQQVISCSSGSCGLATGRMDFVGDGSDITVIDHAHTPALGAGRCGAPTVANAGTVDFASPTSFRFLEGEVFEDRTGAADSCIQVVWTMVATKVG